MRIHENIRKASTMFSTLQCTLEREQDTTLKVLQVCQDMRRAGNPEGACEFCLQACGSRRLGSEAKAESQKWAGVSQWERKLRIPNWGNPMGQGAQPGKSNCQWFGVAGTRVVGGGNRQGRKLTGKAERSPEKPRQLGPRGRDARLWSTCSGCWAEGGLSPSYLQWKSRNAGLGWVRTWWKRNMK